MGSRSRRRAIVVSVVSVSLVGLASAPPALAQAGTLDTTFDDDGKAMTNFTTGDDFIWDIAVQADQKIVGAGTADGGRYFALARYDTDGTLDDTFGGGGRVTTDMTQSDDLINAVGVQVDQKIVVTGRVGGSGGRYGLARYDAGGILDPTFSGDGKVFTNIVSGWDHPYGLAIQPDGKIVAVGATQVRGGAFSVIRYNANGTLDGSFSGDGKLTTNFTSGDDWARDVALQVDGKIVVSGVAGTSSSNKMAALARYNANGTLDGIVQRRREGHEERDHRLRGRQRGRDPARRQDRDRRLCRRLREEGSSCCDSTRTDRSTARSAATASSRRTSRPGTIGRGT